MSAEDLTPAVDTIHTEGDPLLTSTQDEPSSVSGGASSTDPFGPQPNQISADLPQLSHREIVYQTVKKSHTKGNSSTDATQGNFEDKPSSVDWKIQLVRYRNELKKLSITDARYAAIVGNDKWLVTTINRDHVFEPPFGRHRTVVARDNGLYGVDDPLVWPQFACKQALHLACIPLEPRSNVDRHYDHIKMFRYDVLKDNEIEWQTTADYRNNRARITAEQRTLLLFSIDWLKDHLTNPSVKELRTTIESKAYIDSLLPIMDRLLTYVSSFYLPMSELRRGLVELSRAWIYSVAWIEYMQEHRPRIGTGPLNNRSLNPMARHLRGCFTYDVQEASALEAAAIPVWLLQPIEIFPVTKPNILHVITPRAIPEDPHFELTYDSSKAIYCGANGTFEQHAAIHRAADLCGRSSAAESFDFQPRPSKRPPSPSLDESPRRIRQDSPLGKASTSKAVAAAAPAKSADEAPYTPLSCRFAPQTIHVWHTAASSIRAFAARSQKKQIVPLGYMFPNPRLIDGSPPNRSNAFLVQWNHICLPWTRHITIDHGDESIIGSADWRLILNIASVDDEYFKSSDRGRLWNKNNEARKRLLQAAVDPIHPFGTINMYEYPNLDSEHGKYLMWTLCQLNFRTDLYLLDLRMTLRGRLQKDWSAEDCIAALHCWDKCLDFALGELKDSSSRLGLLGCLQPSDAIRGLADPNIKSRIPLLIQLFEMMRSWPGQKPSRFLDVPPAIGSTDFSEIRAVAWETSICTFFCQSFYDNFGRMPVIPHTLVLTDNLLAQKTLKFQLNDMNF